MDLPGQSSYLSQLTNLETNTCRTTALLGWVCAKMPDIKSQVTSGQCAECDYTEYRKFKLTHPFEPHSIGMECDMSDQQKGQMNQDWIDWFLTNTLGNLPETQMYKLSPASSCYYLIAAFLYHFVASKMFSQTTPLPPSSNIRTDVKNGISMSHAPWKKTATWSRFVQFHIVRTTCSPWSLPTWNAVIFLLHNILSVTQSNEVWKEQQIPLSFSQLHQYMLIMPCLMTFIL